MSFLCGVIALVAIVWLICDWTQTRDIEWRAFRTPWYARRILLAVGVVATMCVPVCVQIERTRNVENTARAIDLVIDDARKHSMCHGRFALELTTHASEHMSEQFMGFSTLYVYEVYTR